MSQAARDSVFAKIVAGDIPCQRVFEDEHVLAFLDINPQSVGHTLIIPKRPVERLDRLTAEEAAALGAALPRVAKAVLATVDATDYNVLQNNGPKSGQEVPYVHFHIIPRAAGDGLGYRWKPQQADAEELDELAKKIAAAIE